MLSFLKRIIFSYFIFAGLSFNDTFGQNYIAQIQKIKAKGDSAWEMGNLSDAQKYYTQQLPILLKNKDLHRYSIALSDVSMAFYAQRDYQQAVNFGRKSYDALPKIIANDTTLFRVCGFLTRFYKRTYRLDSVHYFKEKAIALISRSKTVQQSSDLPNFYVNLGQEYIQKGETKKADLYLKKSLSIAHLDPSFDKQVVFNNLGQNVFIQKKYSEAINYYQKAISTNPKAQRRPYFLLNLGEVFVRSNQSDKAFLAFEDAYKNYKNLLRTTPKDYIFESSYYHNLGTYYLENQQFKQAKNLFSKAILLLDSTGNFRGKSFVYEKIGQVYLKEKRNKEALYYFQKAIQTVHQTFKSDDVYQNPPLKNIFAERELFRALIGKAKGFHNYFEQSKNLKDLQMSLQTSLLAFQLGEKMRRSYETAEAKLFFNENYFSAYSDAIETAYALYTRTHKEIYKQNILDLMEKSRATTLADALRETDLKPKTIPAELLTKEQQLYQVISGLQIALKTENDSLKKLDLNKKLVDEQIYLSRLLDRFETDFPNYYQLKYDKKSVLIRDIQQKILNPATALVEYFLTEKKLYIFTITHNKSDIYEKILSLNFRERLTKFQTKISQNPKSKIYNGQTLSAELYQQIISPILDDLKDKKRIIFIRDGELNYLPFEVLAPAKNDYLLKHFAISYAYSSTLLMNEKKEESSPKILALAPFANQTNEGSKFRDKSLRTLPASEEEVLGIRGDIYLNEKASKSRFLEEYRSHGIIHFATHAITNDQEPNQSFIAFYPDNQGYKLLTEELYDLDLRKTRLVILSACEAGRGKLQKGEGIISLARAFAYSGCESVMTTLWNAHDETTANISERFHKYLSDGLRKDEALRKAKLDFLDSELGSRYEHPYYWANFVLIGKAESFEDDTQKWLLVISGLFLMGVLTSYFYKKRGMKN
jgi:CHAT domain-containing protein/tetratricopeptide (TPR) repeat protein